MPRRAARDDAHLLHGAQRVFRDVEVLEEDLSAIERDAAENRVARGGRLLVDFLEHEVLVAALFRRDWIPHHALCRLRDRAPLVISELHAGSRDDRHLLVAEKHDVARVREDGWDVGRDEEFLLAEADDDRRTVADRDNLLGVFNRHQDDREHAAHVRQRSADRIVQTVAMHLALDEVGDDLGIRFRLERVSLLLELFLQLQIVLDDPVVNDDDLAGAVAVRMRVLLGRTAVRRPARVPHTVEPIDRLHANGLFQVRELPCRAAQRDAFRADDRHAGGVVAAIFHAAKSLEKNRDDGLAADVSDDSAHTFSPSVGLSCVPPTRRHLSAARGQYPARRRARPR